MTHTTTTAVMELDSTSLSNIAERYLDKRIQKLPQELQDEIKELVIAAGLTALGSTSGLIHIHKTYKPPLGLQIDGKSREKFAKEYYKAGIVCDMRKTTGTAWDKAVSPVAIDPAFALVSTWLRKLSKPHRELMETIRFNVPWADSMCSYKGGRPCVVYQCTRKWLMLRIDHPNLVRRGILELKMLVKQEDGSFEEVTVRQVDV